jgi:tyrosyl-DNA phosphodiesterase-1
VWAFGNEGNAMQHAKCMLLQFPTCLRVIVSTANLTLDYDMRSNAVWMQDFPRCDTPTASELGRDFVDQLSRFLRQIGRCEQWLALLPLHNFDTVLVRLVISLPGTHRGAEMHRWGHLRMRALLRTHQPMPGSFLRPAVMAQISSVGRLSDAWLYDQFLVSLMPPMPRAWSRPTLMERLSVVWPTIAFVHNCFHGYVMGGSLCGARASFDHACIRNRFVKFLPVNESRRDITPHMKSYCCYDSGIAADSSAPMPLAFYLMTSANLSKPAWGEMQKNETQFTIRNFEMGVLIMASDVDAASSAPKRPLCATDRGSDLATSINVPIIVDLKNLKRITFTQSFDDQPWAGDGPQPQIIV